MPGQAPGTPSDQRGARIPWTRWATIREELSALETEILFEALCCPGGRERAFLDDAHAAIRKAIENIELAGTAR